MMNRMVQSKRKRIINAKNSRLCGGCFYSLQVFGQYKLLHNRKAILDIFYNIERKFAKRLDY